MFEGANDGLSEVIQIENEYYIKATSSLADRRTHVLKHNELFSVFDRFGDIHPINGGEQGLYYGNTRFLSKFEMRFMTERLLLLGSVVQADDCILTIDLTNSDILKDGKVSIEKDSIHIFRMCFLLENSCYQRFIIHNYLHKSLKFDLGFLFSTDFADMFEVRGVKREARGTFLPSFTDDSTVVYNYVGLDKIYRRAQIQFLVPPTKLGAHSCQYALELEPHHSFELPLVCSYEESSQPFSAKKMHFTPSNEAFAILQSEKKEDEGQAIEGSNELFNEWLNASRLDLHLMMTRSDKHQYPYAGIPWFSAPFGRDGIITALETLWYEPTIAKNVLDFLSQNQAQALDRTIDAEPGKIIHEMRLGEMANLKEVPFGKYYGSIDSTPLFLILAEAYYTRTNDLEFIKKILPSIDLAVGWMENYGDVDGDGFIEYAPHAEKGLIHQGWKDSHNSVFHADGKDAKGPIALCEVQAYAYGAYKACAKLARALDNHVRADDLEHKAHQLKAAFDKAFWSNELQAYGLALDGEKKLCRVMSSNAGQCLLTGIVEPGKASKLVQALFTNDMFSGWGIRTLSSKELHYNPMSYHNGSIWPHDNALIAEGLKKYGFHKESLLLLSTFFDASTYLHLHRMPELFCGFQRRANEGPTPYPVACAPQAWSACSVFSFLRAALGLFIKAQEKKIYMMQPTLPSFINKLEIKNLQIGDSSCDLSFFRHQDKTAVNILRKTNDLSVVIEQ